MRVYLDSCIIIYLAESSAGVGSSIARRLFSRDTPWTIVFTDLSRLECRVKLLATGNRGLLMDYDEFFAAPANERFVLDTASFDLATELRARHGLKTPHALHLAAAIASGCEEFWTNDERLARASENRIRILTVDQLG